MKTALYLALCAALAARVRADAFADADKALWIDRHNYFRMSALPFSAGNMLRIKWSDDLATQAQADATACAAKSAGGVNAAVVAATGSVVDAAIQTWVVDAAMGVFSKLAAPKAAGDPVGAGTYNSYSQVVWAATNQVGCAKAACGAQVGVACRYAPAGNDGTSPWYTHAATGTACPDGLVSKVGLCVTSVDDPAYNDIAPIPAGQQSYEVFKDFIPNMQKALKGEAVAPAAAPAAGPASAAQAPAAAPAAAGDAKAPAAPAANATPATPAAPGATPAPGAPSTAPASAAPGASAAPAAGPTAPAASNSTTPAATTGKPATGASATPEPMVTKVVDGKVLVRVPKTTAPAAGASSATTDASATPAASSATQTGGATPEPMVTKVVDGKVLVRVPKTTAPAAGAGSAAAAPTGPSVGDPTAAPEPSVTKVVDGKVYVRVPKTANQVSNDVVGTVKPSDNSGTTFANQATSTAPAAGAAATPAAAAGATAPAPAPAATAGATGANNKSEGGEAAAGGFSAAGVAGVIVIGCVAVAGIAVFMSYRKNQKRQRDIMQNGGIHVL